VKLRIGSLFVFLVILGFGWSAEACEICTRAPDPTEDMCSSGWQSGVQACWGGFGVPCVPAGGSCFDPGGRKREPDRDTYSISDPCPTCMQAEPDQGFMLRGPEYSEASSQRAGRD
jgi:hypothetical protein